MAVTPAFPGTWMRRSENGLISTLVWSCHPTDSTKDLCCCSGWVVADGSWAGLASSHLMG